jgi:CRISPR system Cascade subunit CasD
MTDTLTLRFAGPMQSWGVVSLNDRFTAPVPTRTGILGYLAATLGLPRGWQETPEHQWLHDVDVWCRVDQAGTIETDYHTVSPPARQVAAARRHQLTVDTGKYPVETATDWTVPYGNGDRWKQPDGRVYTMLTSRHYIADAEFIIAVSHPDDARVSELAAAAYQPGFLTYLGRKCFAPAFPFHLGVRAGGPAAVLGTLPTASTRGALPIHQLNDFANPVSGYVTPERTDEPLAAWKAAA